jgi:DNA-binding winged helix-turn-helix (wHTH) protein/Tfp pilus assembly protein PilF
LDYNLVKPTHAHNDVVMTTSPYFIFGSYILNPPAGLFRDDRLVPVPPKELALLTLLVQMQGQVVSHQEIEEKVWPRQIVSYQSLARCVYSLRKLLDPDGHSYVETVHKRGYRLAVAVKKFESSRAQSALAQSISTIPLAYSHYAAGVREANEPRSGAQARAVLLFEEAARVDPGFAAARAALADTRMYQIIRGDLHPGQGLMLGMEAAQKALEVNPVLVQAMSVLAWFKGVLLAEFNEAHALLDEAQAIDPGYSRIYIHRSWIFRAQGLPRESVLAAKRAVDVDPHALLNRHSYSWALFCSGDAAAALALERELRQAYPLDEIAHGYAGIFAAYLGKRDEALEASEAALQLSSDVPTVCAAAAYIFARTGETQRALQLADSATEAVLPRAPRTMLAAIYAELGDIERAFDLLSKARDEGCAWFAPARLDPRLATLQSNNTFLALFSD